MLEVFLVRHAPAYERNRKRWPDDDLRPLTPEGLAQWRQCAAGLRTLFSPPALVLSSALLRARQTVEILAEVAAWPPARICPPLAPGGGAPSVLEELGAQSAQPIALVGHEPDLSQLAAVALAGIDARLSIEMKKGSVLCLQFPAGVRAGTAGLKWLLPSRFMHGRGD